MTDGAINASPAATTRMAATKSAGVTSLSRNPLAPARSASMTCSSVSNVVSTRMRGPRASASVPASCRVASTPSMTGIRISMTITSGRVRAAAAIASRPLAASPTTSMSSSPVSTMRKPVRTSSWSSTSSTRMLMARRRARRQAGHHAEALVRRLGDERPAQHRDPLAHPDQAAALVVGLHGRPAARNRARRRSRSRAGQARSSRPPVRARPARA